MSGIDQIVGSRAQPCGELDAAGQYEFDVMGVELIDVGLMEEVALIEKVPMKA